ncbi:M16 family metallopeptidase [Sphingomonas echinoides]|uniref:Pitrilysin family protein n=1 Tax=Sphingomonas echinoides TaxID=59803 RepID=A0ABU4PJA9_9SPHN|nr:pitrilysin family protein [Sphingomonas echinoides]MDX5983912.1 pitrilysin family protein [Sphingomonas echinoides]
MLSRAALLLGAALLPLTSVAAKPTPPASAPAIKPIAFTERTLANGLRVYAIRDTSTPNVSVQVWYDVGSKDDPAGRSGFAHMFEHLMFKATRNLVSEQMDRLTEDVGGNNNASTNDDYTEYHETIPANHLQRLLFAEADRMAALVVEPKSFASERDVVKEELRQNTNARPYGKLFSLYFPAISYTRHPYARGTIGSLDNLQSAQIDDVRAFHATYYRPDNAVLVVSGNFDPQQLDAWVDQYFAGIKRPTTPIPRVTVTEPERTTATHYVVREANTPLPAVMISYPIPADNDPDNAALTVLNAVLSQGESSRLYETLVYRDQLAQSAESVLDSKQGPGNLAVFAILAGGKQASDGETALRREVARLRDTPVSAAELAEAKNEILTAALESRETAEGKGRTIASSVIIDRDPHAADRQLAAISQVTAADIQRVAAKYLRDERSATIQYLPEDKTIAAPQNDRIEVADSVVVKPLVVPGTVAVVTPASAAERIAPPPAGPAIPASAPAPQEFKLANGLRVVLVEKHDLPLLSAVLIAQGGGALDPADRAGLGSLTADLLTKGTKTRSATEIARQIESLGGSISSDASFDGSSVTVTVKSDQAVPALAILADVTRNPVFASEEIERARAQAIDGVQVAIKNPSQLAGLVAARAALGDTEYGHPLSGTPSSLKAISQADIRRAYAAAWTPGQSTLVLVGDVTPAQAKTLAESNFANWTAPAAQPKAAAPVATYPKPRVIVVDMPGSGQAGVVVARPGIARSDAAYYPAAVANTVLGGGFSSRLNQEIRIKRGLAYGAGSSLQVGRAPGAITARTSTKNPSAPETVSIILAEMKRLGAEPVTAAELETRKAVLVGNFGRATETTGGIAGTIGSYTVQGVPLSELGHYTQRVAAVDPAAVQAAAAKLLDPSVASVVVVGDAKLFLPELRKTYPDAEVIQADALKLDSASLK